MLPVTNSLSEESVVRSKGALQYYLLIGFFNYEYNMKKFSSYFLRKGFESMSFSIGHWFWEQVDHSMEVLKKREGRRKRNKIFQPPND